MRVLLDTHAFLWWIMDDPQLSARGHALLRDGANELFFSAASGWEMAIKYHLGRLQLPQPPEDFLPRHLHLNGIAALPISMRHALHAPTLPPLHRDPFDRMLVSQAQVERLPILTADSQIAQYQVDTVW